MKLHSQQIEMISHAVIKSLVADDVARIGVPDDAAERVIRLVTEDLMVEDRLNDEVREILSKHESEMRMQGVQYHEMFKIVKQRLVRERKLIL